MCDEPVAVRNYLDSADTRSTLDALLTLGAGVDEAAARRAGDPRRGPARRARGHRRPPRRRQLRARCCGCCRDGSPASRAASGPSTATSRSAAGRSTGWWSRSAQMGAGVEAREGRLPPLRVTRRRRCSGIDYELPVASAQVKSCVLIAGLLAAGSTTITEAAQSRDHTERILRRARVPFERDGLTMTVSPGRRARARRDRRAGRPVLGRIHRGRGVPRARTRAW